MTDNYNEVKNIYNIKNKNNDYKRLNWSKYTHFRSRNSRLDLTKLCSKLSNKQLIDVFSTKDKTGLLPIHWAAINNRFDLIDFMLDNGSPIRVKCSNKLFSNGTELHLAAMNGSIQAASILLKKYNDKFNSNVRIDDNQTKPKELLLFDDNNKISIAESQQEIKTNNKNEKQEFINSNNFSSSILIKSWLNDDRDLDGQTALMKSAPIRSKRLDLVRELLRKNYWSLGARPAEMALFLISKGANWREIDSLYGMNLFHLAIINDYDDIINMLLTIDKDLINIPIKINSFSNNHKKHFKELKLKEKNENDRKDSDLESINLNDNSSPSTSSSGSSSSEILTTKMNFINDKKPLISKLEKGNELLESGLMPLQLAIIYSRLTIITILWNATYNLNDFDKQLDKMDFFFIDTKEKRNIKKRNKLRAILLKGFWSNIKEISNFIRRFILKFFLILDVSLILLFWFPLDLPWERSIFVLSFCLTCFMAFKVMLKKPGYLKRYTMEYLEELTSIKNDNFINNNCSKLDKTTSDINDSNTNNGTKTVIIKNNDDDDDNKLSKRESENRKSIINIEERVRLLCHKCKCIRKSRSRHCNYCQHCIIDFDHHCIYLDCCIGRYNRVDFLILMILLTITSTYGILIYFRETFHYYYNYNFSMNYEYQYFYLKSIKFRKFLAYFGLLSIGKYSLIGLISSFNIIRRASLGVTLYEELRSKRIIKIFGQNGPPEEISKFIGIFSIKNDLNLFWRFTPNRFLIGDLSYKRIKHNLIEYIN